LQRLAPEFEKKARTILNAKEKEDLATLKKAEAEYKALEKAFGLTAAKRELDNACDAERKALMALCSYHCNTLEEARIRAEYLHSAPSWTDMDDSPYSRALMTSFSAMA
jgi:hypothetical protein